MTARLNAMAGLSVVHAMCEPAVGCRRWNQGTPIETAAAKAARPEVPRKTSGGGEKVELMLSSTLVPGRDAGHHKRGLPGVDLQPQLPQLAQAQTGPRVRAVQR